MSQGEDKRRRRPELAFLLAASAGFDLSKDAGEEHVLRLQKLGLLDDQRRPTELGDDLANYADELATVWRKRHDCE